MEETTYDAIRRLQQQIDKIDDEIIVKRSRMDKFKGVPRDQIAREIESVLERREAIKRNILQLKRIELQTT
jgi:hypothetical protein